MKTIVPIKKILTNRISIEEFEFIRNNPIVSTIGAAALGGAAVHDYHSNGYKSLGKYFGDKVDTAKNAIGNGLDKTKEMIHGATGPNKTQDPNHHDNSFHQDNVVNHNLLNSDV